ncbi:class F sortase [Prauserella flavalba]|uniref:Class F sortase n=1 Tax=Prauserella flavalba TaxID=1477506 RepID=A0A318M472_9PSEU|nr:class F sortase [Prauserella flavalba]PXY37566.1 class F sortase [Prauserella flavalba]
MSTPVARRFRWRVAAVLGTAVAVAAAVILVVVLGGEHEPAAQPAVSTPTTTQAAPPPTTAAVEATPIGASRPAWLEIPSIGVRTGEVIDLGLEPDGALEVPEDAVTTGWFKESPTPGELGPSVIAGHVDYGGVPGVFFRLHEVRPGDEVTVHREDGTSVVFTVDRVERHAKSEFPTEDVYGNTTDPQLRLITCGGAFDDSTGQYLDNVVAYATMTGVID